MNLLPHPEGGSPETPALTSLGGYDGLTAGHGVIVRLDCANNLRLLAHEFVHVAQYERLGREGFLQEYIQQIAAHGYPDAPFEQEAEAKSIKACWVAGVHAL